MKNKLEVANTILRKSNLYVHLDPRCSDVIVPKDMARQHRLVLYVGLSMSIPIPDLEVDHAGIRGTLSFSRRPFFCNIPWPAVFALVGDDSRGMTWSESMPDEVVKEVLEEVTKKKARPALRLVK